MNTLHRMVHGLVLLALSPTLASAGTIHPRLQEEMARSGPGAFLGVIVNLKEQAPIAALNRDLHERSATLLTRHRAVLGALQDVARRTQGPLKQNLETALRAGSVRGYTSYWISNLIVMEGSKEEILGIAGRPDVDVVELNFTAELITPLDVAEPRIRWAGAEFDGTRGIGTTHGLKAIRAPQVWREFGIDGTGRLVANLDTGVDGNHPALAARWRGYNGQEPWYECWLDLIGRCAQFPCDWDGHGTHVMGTITGLGAATGDTIGVAWGAQWIACNAIDQDAGPAFDNSILAALQWFSDPDGDIDTIDDVPDVVQNSWGISENFGHDYSDCDDRWWNAIDNCEAAGVVTTWSAGNSGPGAASLRSPADRATSLYNAFSVGAVDATHYDWPYPIAAFSSRGPTGCNVPPENAIKPEVVAPGVNVYSSVPGGGYSDVQSGTSMSGPHVAGIVPLIRQANPNLDVETIKRILIETARDEGTPGEDNDYGWGFVDAYEAVRMAIEGFGEIEGHVTNASYDHNPVAGAVVEILGTGNAIETDAAGYYRGWAPAGTYQVEARHPEFRPDTAEVEIFGGETIVRDFGLIDDRGPTIRDVTQDLTTTNTSGPYSFWARVTDPSAVASVKLIYRINGQGWIEKIMGGGFGGLYSASIAGHAAGTWVDYYVWAADRLTPPNSSTAPIGAPYAFYTLYITTPFFSDDVEIDRGWSYSSPGDNASDGLWIRADPVGTHFLGELFQMEDDRTASPGVACFVTGNGPVGGDVNIGEVDGGCTTLTTPLIDLSGAGRAFATYHRWYGLAVNLDESFQTNVTSDDGIHWVPLEQVAVDARGWRRVALDLGAFVNLTDKVRISFKACDRNYPSLVEAGIDDFAIETFREEATGIEDGALPRAETALVQNDPNPTGPSTTIRFRTINRGPVRLEIFDASGRLVRRLVDHSMTAGVHGVAWDCRNDAGDQVGSGVYFCRLAAGAFEQSRRMTILR